MIINKKQVRFYAMYIYTALGWNENNDVSRDVRGVWDDWVDELSIDCPGTLCDNAKNTALRWCWLDTQVAFVRSAVQGIVFLPSLNIVHVLYFNYIEIITK